MTKIWVGVLAGAAGLVAGLLIAKQIARNTVRSDIGNILNKVGLGGGNIEKIADALIVPQV